jgi:predicted DCC family thiol-disulfide oxidoreductase YuxK
MSERTALHPVQISAESLVKPPALRILYDGGCPLCLREVEALRRRDLARHGAAPMLGFVDIDAVDYEPSAHGGISYREAMGRIHGLSDDGTILRDLAVFRRAYTIVGLGWLYGPTQLPLLGHLADGLYQHWARLRLRLTGRPSLESLCASKDGSCGLGAAAE